MWHENPEERNPQSENHGWRRKHFLRWSSIYPHNRFNHGQTALEQRPLHTRWKRPHFRIQEILPEQSNEEVRILQDGAQTHSPRYHRQIWPDQQAKQWINLRQGLKGNVCPSAISNHSAWSTQGTPKILRLLTGQNQPSPLNTQINKHEFHTSGRWFWDQFKNIKRMRTTSSQHSKQNMREPKTVQGGYTAE